jgi:hypothetical protein
MAVTAMKSALQPPLAETRATRPGASGALLAHAIDISPALLAQRRQIGRTFGQAVQLAVMGEEEALQARFDAGASGHSARLPSQLQSAIAQPQAGRFLADEGQPIGEGRVAKSEFLNAMSTRVLAVSQEVLGPFGMAQADCPDLKYWVSHYEGKDAAHVEAVIDRYAPASHEAANWNQYLDALVDRIRAGLVEHTRTGTEMDPEPMPDSIDKQRPPLSVFGIQRKASPVAQLGCASTESEKPATGKAAARTGGADAKQADANLADAKAADARPAASGANAAKLRALYLRIQDSKQPDAEAQTQIGAALYAALPADKTGKYKDAGDFTKKYLRECGGAAQALSFYLFGRDTTENVQPTGAATLAKSGDDKWALAEDPFSQDGHYQVNFEWTAKIDVPGKAKPLKPSLGHVFTLIVHGGKTKFDLYESDFNPQAIRDRIAGGGGYGDLDSEPEDTLAIHFLPSHQSAAQHVGSQSGADLPMAQLNERLGRMMNRGGVPGNSIQLKYTFTPLG